MLLKFIDKFVEDFIRVMTHKQNHESAVQTQHREKWDRYKQEAK